MSNREKFVKVFLTLVFVFGISYVPTLWGGSNPAQVISSINSGFFSSSNTNETVLKAQIILKDLDLYNGRLSGLFGVRTARAVRLFQQNNNLIQNGILDIPTQELLFGVSHEEPMATPGAAYTQIPFTEEGNSLLGSWVRNTYEEEGANIDIIGDLVQVRSFARYSQVSGGATDIVLTTNNAKYSIENISESEITSFAGMRVRVSGILLREENNSGYKHIVINHISDEVFSEEGLTVIDYTAEGNIELQNWILSTYNDAGNFRRISGVLKDIGVPNTYGPGGNPTRFILYAEDGKKYSVENISENRIDGFLNQEVLVRGFVLQNLNLLGINTIVINYVE
jgi:peptidoglycan hydrolase-like protein with peptidoglycan-binding domain